MKNVIFIIFLYIFKNVVDLKVESYNSKTIFIGVFFLKNYKNAHSYSFSLVFTASSRNSEIRFPLIYCFALSIRSCLTVTETRSVSLLARLENISSAIRETNDFRQY